MKLNTKNLKDVEFGFVVLEGGSYLARINVEVKPNKAGDGQNLVVSHTILDPEVVTFDQKKIKNNGQIKVTRWVGLQPSDNYDPDRSIKELGVAAGLDCEDGEEDVTTEALEGKVVRVKIKHRPKDGQFDDRNDVSGWVRPSEDDLALAESQPF